MGSCVHNKGATKDILNFTAHYLSPSATHLYLFLDFSDPQALIIGRTAVAGHKRLNGANLKT